MNDPIVNAVLSHLKTPRDAVDAFQAASEDLAALDRSGDTAAPLGRDLTNACRALLQREDVKTWGQLRPELPLLRRRLKDMQLAAAQMVERFDRKDKNS